MVGDLIYGRLVITVDLGTFSTKRITTHVAGWVLFGGVSFFAVRLVDKLRHMYNNYQSEKWPAVHGKNFGALKTDLGTDNITSYFSNHSDNKSK